MNCLLPSVIAPYFVNFFFHRLDEMVSFITKYQDRYPIKIMCKVLGINRSTYYKCLNHKSSDRDSENQKLDEDILAIYYDTKRNLLLKKEEFYRKFYKDSEEAYNIIFEYIEFWYTITSELTVA